MDNGSDADGVNQPVASYLRDPNINGLPDKAEIIRSVEQSKANML